MIVLKLLSNINILAPLAVSVLLPIHLSANVHFANQQMMKFLCLCYLGYLHGAMVSQVHPGPALDVASISGSESVNRPLFLFVSLL